VSFFPHLIAGPLVHHAEMIPQFRRGRSGRSAVPAARGLAIFAAGLFKKVVIADNLAQFVSPVFALLDAGGGVTTPWAWLALRARGRCWAACSGLRLAVPLTHHPASCG
jgi:alginate O-acetyltransferase complex protein AlgI